MGGNVSRVQRQLYGFHMHERCVGEEETCLVTKILMVSRFCESDIQLLPFVLYRSYQDTGPNDHGHGECTSTRKAKETCKKSPI